MYSLTKNIPNDGNFDEKVQVLSNTDERLKFLGKILNNDSSRNILLLLIEKEITANEIAIQMNISLPLTLNHIHQMIDAGIVVISKIENNNKNQPMKYYSAKSGILILPEKIINKAKNSKSFSKSLKSIMKFAVISFAGVVTWMGSQQYSTTIIDQGITTSPKTGDIIIDKDLIPQISMEPTFSFIQIIVTGIVVCSGLFLIWYSKK